jgi:hypothetical protein
MRTSGAVNSPALDDSAKSQRIRKFGKFFTGYMGTASLVTAALPIPVAKLHLIPTYESQSKFLNTYTSLACFLVFAYIFYNRHALARVMFVTGRDHVVVRFWISLLPGAAILGSIACAMAYHFKLDASLRVLNLAGARVASSVLLAKVDYREIPGAQILIALYLGMFVFAEAAFVLMAMREYLQDTLGYEERDLIVNSP